MTAALRPSLAELVGQGGVVVLSGAGLSTGSGIPDYRGPTGAQRLTKPMTYQEFRRDPEGRRRYWARSHLGWRVIGQAQPNDGHRAVARLQARGLLDGIVTQNVDGLHQAGGASDVIELHGNLGRVVCLRCGDSSEREELAERLEAVNAHWTAQARAINPDGDADLPTEAVRTFRTVDCRVCDGMLKPDVVFFGENVPVDRVKASMALIEQARALLVLGSSLTVMSGYRFVLRAAELGMPVAIVNQGPTRGDGHASIRIDAMLDDVLGGLLGELASR